MIPPVAQFCDLAPSGDVRNSPPACSPPSTYAPPDGASLFAFLAPHLARAVLFALLASALIAAGFVVAS